MCAPQALESRVGLGIGRESSCTAGIGLRVKDLNKIQPKCYHTI